jgi:hypothetical protein
VICVQVLQQLADRQVSLNKAMTTKSKQVHIIRLPRDDQVIIDVMNALNIPNDGPISIIWYHTKRHRQAPFVGAVTLSSLIDFLSKVNNGVIKTTKADLPPVIAWHQLQPPVQRSSLSSENERHDIDIDNNNKGVEHEEL